MSEPKDPAFSNTLGSEDETLEVGVPRSVRQAIAKADAELALIAPPPPPPDTFREEAREALGQVLQLVPADLSGTLSPENHRLYIALRENIETLLKA